MNIQVTPITRKAKNRFSNLMDENETCTIEQVRDGMMFLTSSNRKNHFWVMVDNDPHWMLHWSHKGKEFAPSISKVTLRALRLIILGLVCWFSETWGGAQVFFIVSCFYGIIQSGGHFINCPPPKIDSTSILARQWCQCRGLCHFDNWLQGVAFCQNPGHHWHKSNQPHHTHGTPFLNRQRKTFKGNINFQPTSRQDLPRCWYLPQHGTCNP